MFCLIFFLCFHIFSVPGGTWGGPGGDLGFPGGLLEVPGGVLEGLWGHWRAPGGTCGGPGVDWGSLEIPGVSLGGSLGGLGVSLEGPWGS